MSLPEILLNEDSFSCSWVAENKNICDSVSWGKDYRDGMEAVSVDTCVLLSRGTAPRECQSEIHLVLRKNFRVSHITVVSDARIVEVYGTCGEYVGTRSADFVDQFEDMAVYVAEVALPQPLSECAIKFAGLKTNHQMWLYGIHLTVEEVPVSSPRKQLINFQNVNQMLKRSDNKLSERAEKCQSFLESCSSPADATTHSEITGLLKMFEDRFSANGDGDCPSKASGIFNLLSRFSSCTGPTSGNLEARDDTQRRTSLSPEPPDDCGDPKTLSSAVRSLQDYINCRFVQSEKLLLAQIDEKFRELEVRQNEKLDLILQQLKILNMQTQ